jgi:hypothetical protein
MPWCGGVPSAVRIGAVDGGNAAGAPDGCTHAIVERNDVTAHPAAGDAPAWQDAQRAAKMGATSVSKTGVDEGKDRPCEQDARSEPYTRAWTATDASVDRAAGSVRTLVTSRYGRAKPGRMEPDSARYESYRSSPMYFGL